MPINQQQNGREVVEIGLGAFFGREAYDRMATIYEEKSRIPVCGRCGKKLRFYLKKAPTVSYNFCQGEARRIEKAGLVVWWECDECKKGGPVPADSKLLRLE